MRALICSLVLSAFFLPYAALGQTILVDAGVVTDGSSQAIGSEDVDDLVTPTQRTFAVTNGGAGTLNIASITSNGAEFTVTAVLPSGPPYDNNAGSFTVVFDPTAVGARSATITIVSGNAGNTPFSFTVTGTGTEADLSLTKSITANPSPTPASPTVTFQIDVLNQNNGAQSAASTGFTLTDTVPAGYDPATTTFGACVGFVTGGAGSASLTMTHPGLIVGASASCTFTAEVKDDPFSDSNSYQNSVSVTSASQHDSDPADNTATATATPVEADLRLSIEAVSYNPDTGALDMTVRVSNDGPSAASGVTVSIPELDATPFGGTAPVLTPSAGSHSTGTQIWTVGAVASSGSETLQFTSTLGDQHTFTLIADVAASAQFDGDSTPGNGNTGEDDYASHTVNQYDYGDLVGYGDPRHEIISGAATFSGSVDSESGTQAPNATGDDTNGIDDEGIILPTYLGAGVPGVIAVSASGGAFVSAWIDFDSDGNFTDAGEDFFSGPVGGGSTNLSVTPPTTSAGTRNARFRICSVQTDCDDPTENAPNGEVEDHVVTIIGVDFGDAPDTGVGTGAGNYETDISNDGPRHMTGTPVYLGAVAPDADPDARDDATANGDDAVGDDEDGVVFPHTLVSDATGTTASFTATNVGAGYLSVWVDWDANGVFGNNANEILTNNTVVAATGSAMYPFSIPASQATGSYFARARFCSTSMACNSPTGFASDGEVEDYQVSVLSATNADVTFTAPDDGFPGNPTFEISGGNLRLVVGGTTLFEVTGTPLNSFTFTGNASNNDLTVNMAGGDPIPSGGLTFNGGAGDDHLIVDLASAAGPNSTITFVGGSNVSTNPGDQITFTDTVAPTHVTSNVHTSASAGTASVDELDVVYSELEPVTFALSATVATFTYTGGAETITLDNGGSNDGSSRLTSTLGETNHFVNPSERLIINAGTGNDVVVVGELDTGGGPVYPTAGVNPGIYVNGDLAGDRITVDPSINYEIYADGGDPASCSDPDILDISLDATNNESFSTPVTGLKVSPLPITGTTPPLSVYQEDFEVFAFVTAELAITQFTVEDELSYPGEAVRVTVHLTNNGPDTGQCASVNLTSLTSVLEVDANSSSNMTGPVESEGTLNRSTMLWTMDEIQADATETLVFYGVVNTSLADTTAFTISAVGENTDPLASNNIAVDTLIVGQTFVIPAKLHAQSAEWVTPDSGLERMLLGLYQGSPGLTSAVLCRTPAPDGDLFTQQGLGDTYHECGEGLPHPLYVADLWLDDDGTNEGRVWLAAWGSGGLYYSDDEGETWTAAEPNLPGTTNSWLLVYSISEDVNDGTMYLSANNGLVFRTFDGGANWQQVSSLPRGSAETAWTLVAHPSNAGELYAGTAGRGVFRSVDFGYSWDQTSATEMAAKDALHIFDLEFGTNGSLYAGTSRGIWVTSNSGTSWAELDANQGSLTPTGVAPEIRKLAFGGDIANDGQPDLYGTAWGYGVVVNQTPFTGGAGTLGLFALRSTLVTLLAPTPDGELLLGDQGGVVEQHDPSALNVSLSVANEPPSELPTTAQLDQNHPNPFNPATSIRFAVPNADQVRLELLDVLGRHVATLVDGNLQAGWHEVRLDASALASGSYLYRLHTGAAVVTKTMTLLK
ncbi:MAG: T9SS type A sorting domain-containing protein [Rhodothermales bacterium]|nr:T9SS type A sorting domain-containing protein [Rhodothermales bacterium]MBO6779699.1 T9SS type A sorting domain-containing protein [Rhodothermales bacterium]